ncbi:hypothetical protein WR25_24319 [Diploscapter pachys]|uniref:7TM GPCR serpentine receptor class x (Srx) domain-containing protein n=1 Tax=Diploscapter pachys TaxID=2018661 RepID=A0A2A2LZW1_9BILA|nr:hypothetical protein WR25_24319 [Diploscapter pachys]
MPFTVYEHANDPFNYFMGMLIFSDATIGLVCNVFIIAIFFRVGEMRNSFSIICLFRAFNNTFVLVEFIIDFLPLTIWGWTPLSLFLESTMLSFGNTLYVANQWICILLALNRFIAIYFYEHYDKFCAFRPTLANIEAYGFYYNPDFMSIKYPIYTNITNATLTDGGNVELNTFEIMTKIFTVSVVILNILTFLKISYYYITESRTETQFARERIKKNAKLFLQTLFQDSLYIVDMLFMMYFSTLSDSRFWGFISWTFVWCNVHSVDGVIMLLFTEHKKSLSSLFMQTSTIDEKRRWASRTSQLKTFTSTRY